MQSSHPTYCKDKHNYCVENSSFGKLTIMNTGLVGYNTVLLGEYFKDHAPLRLQGLEVRWKT